MRILLINTSYPPSTIGGAEESVRLTALALSSASHQVEVLAVGRSDKTAMRDADGIRVTEIPARNLYRPFDDLRQSPLKKAVWHAIDSFNLAMYTTVCRELQQSDPDVVHSNNLSGFSVVAWLAARRLGIPIVHTLRDYYLACPRSSMFLGGKNCSRQCLLCSGYGLPRRKAADWVGAVVGVSNFILQRHVENGYFLTTPIREVIHSPVVRKESRSERRPSGAPLTFGFMGRLHPTKGVEALLEAWRRYAPADARLLVAGHGDERYLQHLRSLAAPGGVKFAGFVAPDDFYEVVDVLIVPSLWHDPLPRTILEAYSHGVPVIASDRGGIPEQVVPGETGLLFQPEEPMSLGEAIRSFCAEPFKVNSMRDACLQAAGLHAPEVIASKYLGLYQDVLALGKHGSG